MNTPYTGGGRDLYQVPSSLVKKIPAEEQIKARLRELTAETRRVREDLQVMIRREPDRARAFSHDRPYKLKREKPEKPKASTSGGESPARPDSDEG